MPAFPKWCAHILLWGDRTANWSRFVWQYRTLRLRRSLKSCGSGVQLELPLVINHPESVQIGNEVSIAGFTHIWGGGGVSIGDRVLIGSHSAITSETHDYRERPMYHSQVRAEIKIENDVWIGTHVVILPGVTVGEGSVIGAGAVVTRSIPANSIALGVPAVVVKTRP